MGVAVKFREGTGEKGGKCLGNAVSEERAMVEENPINTLGKTNKQSKNKPIKRSMTAVCIYRHF